jgi:hypothetical protein
VIVRECAAGVKAATVGTADAAGCTSINRFAVDTRGVRFSGQKLRGMPDVSALYARQNWHESCY